MHSDMGTPPSILAETYGKNAAELAACYPGNSAVVKKYGDEAIKQLQAKSKKPIDATNNMNIFESSYKDQSARYKAETDSPSCSDLVDRIKLR